MAARVNKNPVLGYSPYEHFGSINPFDRVFTGGSQNVKEKGFEGIDAMVLWGGTDIPPSYYDQFRHSRSGAPQTPSERDVFEKKAILYCRTKGIPLLGVCRGAQLLCVMAGGSLAQHVSGHNYDHYIDTIDGKHMLVTSTHHQMMNPNGIEHTLIGWTDVPRSKMYEGALDEPIPSMQGRPEPEIVYFPQLKGLAIQGHPEYSNASAEFVSYCNKLIVQYLLPPF